MSVRESLRCYLRDFADKGATFWMSKSGWYWAKAGAGWKLGDKPPVYGPFSSACEAGWHAAGVLKMRDPAPFVAALNGASGFQASEEAEALST